MVYTSRDNLLETLLPIKRLKEVLGEECFISIKEESEGPYGHRYVIAFREGSRSEFVEVIFRRHHTETNVIDEKVALFKKALAFFICHFPTGHSVEKSHFLTLRRRLCASLEMTNYLKLCKSA